MLHPSQFYVNEAWIFFKLNDRPISTEIDGEFDVFALMDAASLYTLGSEFIPVASLDSAIAEMRRLLEVAQSHKRAWPSKLLVAARIPVTGLVAEAEGLGIVVSTVTNDEIAVFTREARQGFKEHFGAG